MNRKKRHRAKQKKKHDDEKKDRQRVTLADIKDQYARDLAEVDEQLSSGVPQSELGKVYGRS